MSDTKAHATQMQAAETRLREMILDMQIGPGERIPERWAEGQLGASRTSVRAALLRLENEGLVCREGRGWKVTPIHLDEIAQLFVYREVLEVAAVRLAASRTDIGAGLAEIGMLLDSCGPDASREDAHVIATEFHIQLARLSGNDFIARGVADALNRLARARWLDTTPTHPDWDEHRAVVAALHRQDADTAARLIETHVRESRDRLLKALDEGRRTLRARGVVVA
jgi:DNA-binding GntR family transcriptional regulator